MNVEYQLPLGPAAQGFLGSSLTYNSKAYAGLGTLDTQRIDAFAPAGPASGRRARSKVAIASGLGERT